MLKKQNNYGSITFSFAYCLLCFVFTSDMLFDTAYDAVIELAAHSLNTRICVIAIEYNTYSLATITA